MLRRRLDDNREQRESAMSLLKLRLTTVIIAHTVALSGALVTGHASAQGDGAAPITPAPAFGAAELAKLPTDGWLTNGGNLWNQRYSPLRQINRENVARLKGVWRVRLGGSGV